MAIEFDVVEFSELIEEFEPATILSDYQPEQQYNELFESNPFPEQSDPTVTLLDDFEINEIVTGMHDIITFDIIEDLPLNNNTNTKDSDYQSAFLSLIQSHKILLVSILLIFLFICAAKYAYDKFNLRFSRYSRYKHQQGNNNSEQSNSNKLQTLITNLENMVAPFSIWLQPDLVIGLIEDAFQLLAALHTTSVHSSETYGGITLADLHAYLQRLEAVVRSIEVELTIKENDVHEKIFITRLKQRLQVSGNGWLTN